MRRLLVLGATAVIQQVERRRQANKTSGNDSPWLRQLLTRKPKKLAAIALANKMARTIRAMMVSGETYRGQTAAWAGAKRDCHD